jgi:hypothetical protein
MWELVVYDINCRKDKVRDIVTFRNKAIGKEKWKAGNEGTLGNKAKGNDKRKTRKKLRKRARQTGKSIRDHFDILDYECRQYFGIDHSADY